MNTSRHPAILSIATLLLLITCLSPVPTSALQLEPTALIETGHFHGDEVHARSGQHWLALYASAAGSTLDDVTVTVRTEPDYLFGDDDSTPKGKHITVPGRRRPVFLVKGIPSLTPGAVTTVLANEIVLDNKSDMTFRLGDLAYRLWVSTSDKSESGSIDSRDSKLMLSVAGKRQVLYSLRDAEYLNGPNWWVCWAGDLDGDGLLDLYVDAGVHYNESVRRLYLSSGAEAGQLVRHVALHRTLGC